MAKRQGKSKATGQRASWKGQLSFGLVSFPVEAFNALNRQDSDIHFHQLHAKCHRRIQYEKVCPVHGPVKGDEIVKGYEVSRGKYVEFDPDELSALRTEREKGLQVDAFLSPETIDPLYFDGRMYYVLPAGKSSEKAYDVVLKAMELEEQYGVGRIVMSGKDQVVLLRPMRGVLQMAMLNYSAEILDPKSRKASVLNGSKELKMARSIVRQWADPDFDFNQYQDNYRERVEDLIESKMKDHHVEEPIADEDEPVMLNLMEALQKSLAQTGKRKQTPTRKTRKTRSA